MSDLAQWNVHGPVHTLRSEHAEWDLSLEQWQAAKRFTLVGFHPDGRINENEGHNPDGSISRSSYAYDAVGRMQEARFGMDGDPTSKNIYFYDGRGRLARVVGVDRDGIERESEAYIYSQDGKKTRVCFRPKQEPNAGTVGIDVTALSHGDTDEVLLRDDDDRLLSRVTFTRDNTGRLISAQIHFGEQAPFPDIEKELENATPEAREAAAAAFVKVFGPKNIMSSTTFTYDEKGLLQERSTRMGELGVHRMTFRYDDHDNPIEETNEHISRGVQIDEEGNLHPTKETSSTQNVRFEYKYDSRGNWTEQVVWSQLEPNPNFERSNVTRREITYYSG